jgi:restriction system protein
LLDLVRKVQSSRADRSAIRAPRAAPSLDTSATPDVNVACPICDADMVPRENRSTRAQFWGCANYPRCMGTRRNSPGYPNRLSEMRKGP